MNASSDAQDKLTGALTKDAFEPAFLAAIKQVASNGRPLSLASLDIDTFLTINDTYGMKTGDVVLKSLVDQIVSTVPEDFLVYRMGGDEFAILMPATSREEGLLLMERIRSRVAEPRTYGSAELSVNISAGISSFPIDGREADELLRKADQALYRAKKDGGRRVLLAYDEKMIPKTVHFTETQLERLSALAEDLEITEARLLREALDDLIAKYTVTKVGV